MKRTQICAFALMLALIVPFTGCGKDSEKSDSAVTPVQALVDSEPASVESPDPAQPEPEDGAIRVSTAGEFLEAIAPGAVIELAPGTYNLTEYLGNISDDISDYVGRGFCSDGWQAEINGVDGLTIRGAESGGVEVVAEPRHADVLFFNACSDIRIENITFGHTIEQGECEGAVLDFDSCRNIDLDGLDLYGCGTFGVAAGHTTGITLTNSIIRDCSYGIIDLNVCSDVIAKDCTFKDNEGFYMLSLMDSFTLFDGCVFTGNEGDEFLHASAWYGDDSGARFERCTFGRWESERLGEELGSHGNYMIGSDCGLDAEIDRHIVRVSNVKELIESIAPDTEILLAPGRYNLSEDITKLLEQRGERFTESMEFVTINEAYDGPELIITGVSGLTIASESGSAADTEIVTDPRHADVIRFEDCSGVGVMNLTMGHTEIGECFGNVLYFDGCSGVVLYGLDLYGCGVYGVGENECGRLSCFDSTIRDCESGALSLFDAKERQIFLNCVMTGSGGGGDFSVADGSNGKFNFYRCTFGEQESNDFAFDDAITVWDCDWSEITEAPDYFEESEEDFERVALDTTCLKIVPFDTKVLTDEYYYICYETVNRQSGDVSFENGSDVRFLTFEEDGTGCFWINDDFGRPYSYAMDGSYSCVLSFDDGHEGVFCLYADEGTALPQSEEGMIWLQLTLDDEVLWFY